MWRGASFFIFGVTLPLFFGLTTASAQPSVALSAEARDSFTSILFTFVQDDIASMDGCHYNLFAADEPQDLKTLPGKGLSIATFYRPWPTIQIIAGPLPRLAPRYGHKPSRTRRSAKVYFRTLLSCPQGISGMGETISVTLDTFPRGRLTSINRLRSVMKYHMRYYNPPAE